MKDTLVLGIESSCDETAASVVKNGRTVLSNIISSQIDIHTLYGGVVPEIASRKHIERINYVIKEALSTAGAALDDIDVIAVTCGPGLVGALLVGVAEAKALAFAKGKPLVGVNHIEGHVSANFIEHPELEPPFLCEIISGGHTHLVVVEDYGSFRILGRTRDDAAGEAFDKVARAMGLGYPGGPKIDKIAKEGNPHAIEFPRAHVDDAPYDFSFSGLKSAVLNYLNQCEMKKETVCVPDVAASFQQAVVDVLVGNAMRALEDLGSGQEVSSAGIISGQRVSGVGISSGRANSNAGPNTGRAERSGKTVFDKIALAGGVASNTAIRAAFAAACQKRGVSLYVPSPVYCTDNAAMIASAGYYEYQKGVRHGWDLNAVPQLKLM